MVLTRIGGHVFWILPHETRDIAWYVLHAVLVAVVVFCTLVAPALQRWLPGMAAVPTLAAPLIVLVVAMMTFGF